ncbi:hypothetical protein [Shewanella ulleungensis]|uniref:hypothetical protein n=1 Tax=Shewanella ulleungensis TaxID=2282699 RepID=UPI003D7A488D
MKYFTATFWNVTKKQRYDNVVYVLLLTLVLIYFPKGSLPKEILTKHPDLQSYSSTATTNAYSVSSSQFIVPFIGCFTRFTANTLSSKNASGSHFWDNRCFDIDFDYKIIREGDLFTLYYHHPLPGQIKVTEDVHSMIDSSAAYAIRKLYPQKRRHKRG